MSRARELADAYRAAVDRCPCPVCEGLDRLFPEEGVQLPLVPYEAPARLQHRPSAPLGSPRLGGHFIKRRKA